MMDNKPVLHVSGFPSHTAYYKAAHDAVAAEFPLLTRRTVSPRLEAFAFAEFLRRRNAALGCDTHGNPITDERRSFASAPATPFVGTINYDDEGLFARAVVCAHLAGVALDLSSSDALFAQLNEFVAAENLRCGYTADGKGRT